MENQSQTLITNSLDLNNVVTTRNLKIIYTGTKQNPTSWQIKQAIKTENRNANLLIDKIEIINITKNKATIISNDENIYLGSIIVNYQVSQFQFLAKINKKIETLAVSKKGIIYLGTENEVYQSTTNNSFQIVETISGFVTNLVITNNETIYIGLANGKIYKKENDKIILVAELKHRINFFVFDSKETIYVATSNGIFKSILKTNKFQALEIENDNKIITSLAIDKQDHVYARNWSRFI